MTIDDEIQALLKQADALKAIGKAEKDLEAATKAYRQAPSEKTKVAYRKANNDLATARATARAERPLGVGGDAVASEGEV